MQVPWSKRVGTKLMISYLIVAAVIFGIAIYSFWAMTAIDSKTTSLYMEHLQPLEMLSDVSSSALRMRGDMYKFLVIPDARPDLVESIAADQTLVTERLASYADHGLAEEERALFAEVQRAWDGYLQAFTEIIATIDRGEEDAALADIAAGKLFARRAELTAALTALQTLDRESAMATHDASDELISNALWLLAAAVLAGLLLALGLGWYFGRSIARNVATVTAGAQGLAAGDLSRHVDVHSGDEFEVLASSFNTMADRLQERMAAETETRDRLQRAIADYTHFTNDVANGDLTVRLTAHYEGELLTLAQQLNSMVVGLGQVSSQVRSGTHAITAAASEILATVSQHTASANEQSSAINQVTATVSEAQSSSQQSASKASDLAQMAQDASRVGQEGAASVEDILRGMQDIHAKVQGIAHNILALSEQTQMIGEIIASVTDIADQSNILAINAAIEAAKAGEQGKGFAVVAGEVRNLAEQSKQATSKVRTILGDIQKATNTAVLATEQGTRGVESGMVLTQRAGDIITQLTTNVRTTAQSSQQIAAASRQQSVAMDQIAQAMREINQATIQFVAGARQSQAAAEGLNTLAQQLFTATDRYKV